MGGNRRVFKWQLAVFITLAAVGLLTLLLYQWCHPQAAITAAVLRDLPALTSTVERIRAEKSDRDVTFPGVAQISYRRKTNSVKFDCRAFGFGSETSYFGFYFSPNDTPLNLQTQTAEAFVKDGAGFRWAEAEEVGDNWEFTVQIAPQWYYYALHY